MNVVTRLLERIFGPKKAEESPAPQLTPELHALIRTEVEAELKRLVQDIVVPEIRHAVSAAMKPQAPEVEVPTPEQVPSPVAEEAAGAALVYPSAGIDNEEEVLPLVDQPAVPPAATIVSAQVAVDEALPLAETPAASAEPPTTPRKKLKPPADIRLGFDFGTTTTAVSIRIGDELPRALPIGERGETYMPSVAYFSPGRGDLASRVIVGEAAENIHDSTYVIRSVKRCLGCQGTSCGLQPGHPPGRFPWCKGDGKIQITERECLAPQHVAYFIFREALRRAVVAVKEQHGIDLDVSRYPSIPINMGCGADFDLVRRQLICKSAEQMGFGDTAIRNVVEEPILAGFAFSRLSSDIPGRFLIFDFGGGTLDVAVVDVSRRGAKPVVTVLATAGDNWLGGDDIDYLVYKEFVGQIGGRLGIPAEKVDSRLTAIDRMTLRGLAKRSKERLSSETVFADSLFSQQAGSLPITLTREQLENLLLHSGLLERSKEATLRALKLTFALDYARTSDMLDVQRISALQLYEGAKSVDRVVLVGGVTKIPCVRKEIENVFGAQKVIQEEVLEPISAVAIGAAYPKEAEHFSISAPPYGFAINYRSGGPKGAEKHHVLLNPYTQLEYYGQIYANSIPHHSVPMPITVSHFSSNLVGFRAGETQVEDIRDLGVLEPGQYEFWLGLDGSIGLQKQGQSPRELGRHPFAHPLQTQIVDDRRLRLENARQKALSKSLRQEYIDGANEN